MRTVVRVLVAGLAALALVVGLTATSGHAAPAPARAQAPSEVSPGCQPAYDNAVVAVRRYQSRERMLTRAAKVVKRKARAVNRAETRPAKQKARTSLRKARTQREAAKVRRNRSKATALRAVRAYQACEDEAGTDPGTDPGTEDPSVLQPVCDAGLPQAICDAFGTLPTPPEGGGDGTTPSPIQELCDTGLPQAICDAATPPVGDDGSTPIQPLCDAGLPQEICDLAAGQAPPPDGIPTIPGLPDFPGLPALPGL